MHIRPLIIAALSLTAGLSAQGVHAETGDAGQLITTGQATVGCGDLTTITGALGALLDVDLYLIQVDDPSTFSASTCNAATLVDDTRLYLFDASGTGLSFNDDTPLGTCIIGGAVENLKSTVTGQFLPGPGLYWLGITEYYGGPGPRNSNGLAIWNFGPFQVERQPDGPGAGNPVLYDWFNPTETIDTYQIDLTGAKFSQQTLAASVTVANASCVSVTMTSLNQGPISGGIWDLEIGTNGSLNASDFVLWVFKLGPTTAPGFAFPLPSYNNCEVLLGAPPYVQGPMVTGSTTHNYVVNIPGNPIFHGAVLSTQGICADPTAAGGSGLFFTTDALEGTIYCQ